VRAALYFLIGPAKDCGPYLPQSAGRITPCAPFFIS
jgi:hypothetical protein